MYFQVETSQQQGTSTSGVIRGIIAKEATWCTNEERKKWTNPEQITGFGQRYRVRIVGVHDQKEIPDDKLPVCSVLMPVTAGSGHANASQTANIKEGTWVKLEAQDGADGTEYLIVGILPNDSQNQTLPAANDQKGFNNKTGYGSDPYRSADGIAEFGIKGGGGKTESNSGSDTVEKIKIDDDQEYDGKKEVSLPSKRKCGGDETQGIQVFLRDLIQDVERLQDPLNSVSSKLSGLSGGIDAQTEALCQKASDYISGKLKNTVEEIRKNTLDLIQQKVKKEYGKIWEQDRPKLKKIQDKVWELISCLFNKFIDSIPGIVKELVCSLFKKIVNVPSCIAQNVAGSILGQILGPLIALISNLLQPLLALLGVSGGISGILGLIQGLVGFFLCEEEEDCNSLLTWSLWDGPGAIAGMQTQFNLTALFGAAAGFASQISGLVGQVQSAVSGAAANFGAMVNIGSAVSSVISGVKGCTGDPQKCGPPTVDFFGQAKKAAANAVVSAAGDLLAVDLVNAGSTFGINNPPEVMIQDGCRKGSGGNAYAEYAPAGGGAGGGAQYVLTNIVVDTPGDGYLPRQDGSRGGDGRQWSKPNQTIVRRENKDWEIPLSPGEPIKLRIGDEITIPDNSKIDFPIELVGGVTKVITRDDVLFVASIDNVIEITAPTPIDPEEIPTRGNADSYGVFLTMCDPRIIRKGLNYQPTDKIKIFPESNGAELEPVFGPNGTLEEIRVLNPGNGFDFWPTIYVESETGYNAKILPNFCVNRVDEVKEVPTGVPIIQVVDCVGRLIPQN